MIQQLEGHIILLGEAKPLFLLFKRCDEMALTNYFQNIRSLLCIFGWVLQDEENTIVIIISFVGRTSFNVLDMDIIEEILHQWSSNSKL